ncbi:MAG: alpha/beta hydrolase [Spongiibacteraceae bacterium]
MAENISTPEQFTLPAAGLNLIADVIGPSNGAPIIFLHGSGQTRQSWGSALQMAAQRGYRAYALDLRGHGDSDWAPDGQYSLDLFAEDLRRVIEYIGKQPVLVGASLGGLASMLAIASSPTLARALVLVDITPRVEMSGAQEVMAFMESAPDGYASLDEAADAVAAYLPHRKRPKTTSGLLRNLRERDGRFYWHWDPAFMQMGREANRNYEGGGKISKSEEDAVRMPLEAAASKIAIPTLLIRGGRSRIVSDESVREFMALVPHAEFVDIPDAHHMVAGDANDAFNEAVFQFIDKQFIDEQFINC